MKSLKAGTAWTASEMGQNANPAGNQKASAMKWDVAAEKCQPKRPV